MQQKTHRAPEAGERGEAPNAALPGAETVQAPTNRAGTDEQRKSVVNSVADGSHL